MPPLRRRRCRRRRRRRAVRAFLLASLGLLFGSVTGIAFANDTAIGGAAADLVPLTTTEVRMKGEDILITAVGEDWEVQADYTFENLRAEPVQLQVGFPEYACEGGGPDDEHMCDPEPLRFESMRTTVDGEPVQHRKGTIKKGHPWRPRLGQVWLFDVSFAPGRETKITHRYRVAQGQVSDGTALGWYVTRTGAGWADTIGHARFRIHVPENSRRVSVTPANTGLTLTQHVVDVGGTRTGELLLEATNWEPATDLEFSFFARPGALGMATYDHVHSAENELLEPLRRCRNIIAMYSVGQMRAEPNPGDHIPPIDPTEDDVTRIALEGLGNAEICRGYVYAMYGKRFEDDKLNRYFYGYEGWKPKGWPYGPMQPNPGYTDALLTPADRATLQLIDRVEKRVMPPVERPAAVAASAPARPASGTRSATSPRAAGTKGGCAVRTAPQPGSTAWTAGCTALALLLASVRARRWRRLGRARGGWYSGGRGSAGRASRQGASP